MTQSSAQETAALRRAVLRPHLTIEEVAVSGDSDPTTAYLAVHSPDDRAVIGCLRLQPVACPWPDALAEPAVACWQLRAMAVDPAARGTGVGRVLVEAAVAHVIAEGGEVIWCNARSSAEAFYARLGFRTVTDPFAVPDVPDQDHVGMVLDLRELA